jgi:L-glutamine-phosphate cytidylyltransferase
MMLRRAVILAAGMGRRLKSVVDDRPKGLIDLGGETLVGRSIRLLRDHGIRHITIVAGHRAENYRAFAGQHADVHVVENRDYATTGSMASLAIALEQGAGDDILVLESDIVYERRALEVILASNEADATLVSGTTSAGDEVWVSAPGGALHAMSKTRSDLPSVIGEFVGISRLSAAGAAAMRSAFQTFVARLGHGRMDYETGALVDVARVRRIAVLLIPDLCWGEIDDEHQHARVVRDVWPRVQ